MRRVPVVIISGFLGSGKTTLLLNMLQVFRQKGKPPAVLINERGKIDIDGMLVSRKSNAENVETLLDGCICCSKKSEIASSIDKLLQTKPDAIFIELTGVADPEEVAKVLNESEIIAKVSLRMVITVVDSEYLLNNNEPNINNLMNSQTRLANFIVVNKTDLIAEKDKGNIEQMLREQNSSATIVFGQYGNIDMEQMLNRMSQSVPPIPITDSKSESPAFTSMTTTALPIEKAVRMKDVEAFFKKHAGTIIRAKGFVPISAGEKERSYLLQYSGVQRMEWKEEETDRFYLVLIGVDLNGRDLKEKWLSMTE
ncbi:GTP-binding protein [Bacillus sp. B15-48]|uniref:CobW family GTP-binding protein n=1 Tax=Bacillus sp. B15-48 TaxID=1548601 RepID=UPI00193EE208|nr:GTP-binding protein [Bacillus sp. B15-48]MBM4763639.1 hypothetical protein [Bacillus sp. B15-48]